ncbi:hypothetical protein [Castellaniella sp.]|uniref:hypothetical protein n=1 Tax=Castellaniella sp. TaxID=1955812 RepID=UPI002AFEFBEA|nr:hypothetical protein [Castellaniella sp.]
MKLRYTLALTAAILCAPLIAQAAQVKFINQSSWNIQEIYFAPSSQTNWGEDHLGKDILEKGDSLTLSDVSKGVWDVRVVDEDGDECIISEVTIDGSDSWTIRDDDLLACQANS